MKITTAIPRPNGRLDFLASLASTRPVHYAGKLLAVSPQVDVAPLLGSIWSRSLARNGPEIAVFLATQLVETPGDSPARQRLAASIGQTSDYKTSLLPALTTELDRLVSEGKYTAEQIASARGSLEAVKLAAKLPTPGFPLSYGVQGAVPSPGWPKVRASAEPTWGYEFPEWDWKRGLWLAAGLALAAAGVLYVNGDLPPGAGWGKRLLSRFVIFLADYSLCWWFWGALDSPPNSDSLNRPLIGPSEWAMIRLGWIVLFGWIQQTYLGGTTWPTQAILFLLNLPLTAFLLPLPRAGDYPALFAERYNRRSHDDRR